MVRKNAVRLWAVVFWLVVWQLGSMAFSQTLLLPSPLAVLLRLASLVATVEFWSAVGANLLKLHPCIEVSDGSMGVVKKYRGSMEKVVADYLRDRLEGRTDLDESRAILVDTCEDDHLAAIAREILQGRFDEVLEAKAGCTIFSHCGPRTLGVLLLRK